jgi:hypothetical protein
VTGGGSRLTCCHSSEHISAGSPAIRRENGLKWAICRRRGICGIGGGTYMQIGATTWGQQWALPAIDARAIGQQGRSADRIDPASGTSPVVGTGSAIGTDSAGGAGSAGGIKSSTECQTCRSRKYSDGSSDPTVSFQTPTKLSPEQADTAVRSHEQEHVVHEQARARESGKRVVSQSVAIHTAICPECGRSYVSGGTTTTVTKPVSGQSAYSSSGSTAGSSSGAMVDRRM